MRSISDNLCREYGLQVYEKQFSGNRSYGLTEERKCSNWKLGSYGDFTSENILQSINFNGFVLDEAWHDYPLVSGVLDLLGAIDHPDDPGIYEQIFLAHLCPDDFKGKTKLQIEQMLTERKHQELLAAQSKAIRERIAAEQAQNSMLHKSIAGLFEQFEEWLERQTQQRRQDNRFIDEREEAKDDDDYEKLELY